MDWSARFDLPAGVLETPLGNAGVRTRGEREHSRSLEEIVVDADVTGGTVYLRDVASVIDDFGTQVSSGRFAGKRSMTVYVFKNPGEDAIEISKRVKKFALGEMERLAGTSIQVEIANDRL